MQVNDNYLDELFAGRLGNMEVPPPENGWFRIANELNRRSSLRRKIWAAAASVALIMSVTAASLVYVFTNIDENDATVAVIDENDGIVAVIDENDSHDELVSAPSVNEDIAEQTRNDAEQTRNDVKQTRNDAKQTRNDAKQDRNDAEQQPSTAENVIYIYNGIVENQNDTPIVVDSFDDTPTKTEIHDVTAEILETPSEEIAQKNIEILEMKTEEPVVDDSPVVIVATPLPIYNEINILDISNSNSKAKLRNRWEIMGQFAKMKSYRTISKVPSGLLKSDFDLAESSLSTYSGGISLSYKLNRRLSIQTGAFYLQMGQSISNVIPVANLYASISSNNSYKKFVRTSTGSISVASTMKSADNSTYSSYFNAESPTETKANNNSVSESNTSYNSANYNYTLIERVDYLEIPVALRFNIIDRRFNLYVLGGINANVLLETNVFIDNGSELVKNGIILLARPMNYSSTVGLGLGYQIIKNLTIGVEPSFKYFLHPYTTGSQIVSNPYSYGIYTGIMYRF